MEDFLAYSLRRQYGAMTQMIRNAIEACPDDLWEADDEPPSFAHLVYHTIFFLDFYIGDSPEQVKAFTHQDFAADRDPDLSKPPSKLFGKEELLAYLDRAEEKSLDIIENLDAEDFARRCAFDWKEVETVLELLINNLRHLCHHVGQLNFILHEAGNAPAWVEQM